MSAPGSALNFRSLLASVTTTRATLSAAIKKGVASEIARVASRLPFHPMTMRFGTRSIVRPSGISMQGQPALDLPPATEEITPFEIRVPQAALDDLKRRLEHTRWPEAETVQDWSQGVPLRKVQALVAYWRDQYDWRKFETRVNALPQFRTRLDGLGIHFIHVRSAHEDALPLLLTHGWPGSFREFLDVIGPLVDPTSFGGSAEDAFHVVIPSLPGFGFSDKPAEQGWNTARIARAWANLMQRLGYRRWVAQGGDWGAGITRELAVARPEGLVAAHVNFPYFVFRTEHPTNPTPAEIKVYADAARFEQDGTGYFSLLTTRPQTIGYALADSRSDRRRGSTRSFKPGRITREIRKMHCQWMRCSTTSHSTG